MTEAAPHSPITEFSTITVPFYIPDIDRGVYTQNEVQDKEHLAKELLRKVDRGHALLYAVRAPDILTEVNRTTFSGAAELVEQAGVIRVEKKSLVSEEQMFDRYGVVSMMTLNYYRSYIGTQKLYGSLTIGMLDNGLLGSSINSLKKGPSLDKPESIYMFYEDIWMNPSAALGSKGDGLEDVDSIRVLIDGGYAEGQHAVDTVAVKLLRGARSFVQQIQSDYFDA